MPSLQRFASGLRWNLLSLPLQTGLSILSSVLLAHALGARGYGNYAVIWSFYSVFGVLTDFGSSAVVAKFSQEWAEQGRGAFARHVFGLLAYRLGILAAAVVPTFFLTGWLAEGLHLDYSGAAVFGAFAALMFFETISGFMEGALTSLFEIKKANLCQLAFKAALCAALAVSIFLKLQFGAVIALVSAAYGLQTALNAGMFLLVLSRVKEGGPGRFDRERVKKLALTSYSTKLSALTTSPQFVTMLLAFFLPPAVTGLFSFSCDFVMRFVQGPVQPVANLLLPSFSSASTRGSRDDFKELFRSVALLLCALLLPSTAAAMAIARPLLRLMYPSEFWGTEPQILALLPCLSATYFLLFILGNMVLGYERYEKWIKSRVLTSALLGVVVLIAPYVGIAWTTFGYGLALLVTNACLYHELKSEFALELPWKFIGQLAMAAAIYLAVVRIGTRAAGAEDPLLMIVAAVALAAVLFPLALRALGVDRKDKDRLRETGVPELALRWL